jgi:hypothetical protein
MRRSPRSLAGRSLYPASFGLALALVACSTPYRQAAAPVVYSAPPIAPAVIAPAPVVEPAPPPAVAGPVAPAPSVFVAPPAPVVPMAVESDALAARFPDPVVRYRTPAFEPGHPGFTSNQELRDFIHLRAGEGPDAGAPALIDLGSSQTGVPLEALRFSRPSAGAPHPVVVLIGQQHGDEPAGAEALLVIAQELMPTGKLAPLLDRIDVVILPRANPDGAALNRRGTASGIDPNRDQLLLRTPEAQAQAQLMRDFNPIVVVDAHEFGALGRYVEKFGAAQRFDALIQYATVANMSPLVTRASEEWFRLPLRQALKGQGLSNEWYYTSSADPKDKKLSMGGVQPDTGRNVDGLRNAVSLLIETRGADLGRAHLLRRVHTHVVAMSSLLNSAAARADDLQKLRHFVDAEVAAKACHGDVVIEAAPTSSEFTLAMLDPLTGADKSITVSWDSALALNPLRRRPRPCGYWLSAEQSDAVLRLRSLGVQVQRVEEPGEMRGEAFVADGVAPRIRVTLSPMLVDAGAGSYYVGLDQPLANLVVAALEPDSPNSYAANGILVSVNDEMRIFRPPDMKTSAVP